MKIKETCACGASFELEYPQEIVEGYLSESKKDALLAVLYTRLDEWEGDHTNCKTRSKKID